MNLVIRDNEGRVLYGHRVLQRIVATGKTIEAYVFDLRSASVPDVAVTLVKAAAAPPRAVEITPEEIKAASPKYDPELMIGFLRRAHNAALMRKLYPDLYQGYNSRTADYTSDSGVVRTTVTQIHRFSKEDALVLEGTVQNETAHSITFDGRAATVLVANEVHPVKLLDCLRPIPAGATVPIDVVIQGDVDGGRANLSIENEMRIICRRFPARGRSGTSRTVTVARNLRCRRQRSKGQFR